MSITPFPAIILAVGMFISSGHSAMVGYPLKVTVQQNDTLDFPPLIKYWKASDANITVNHTNPSHGTLQVIPNYFTTQRFWNNLSAYGYDIAKVSPNNFPGFRYIPQAGFTGRDTFYFTAKNSTDSTNVTLCEILVHPPEPGGMTVLLVVNQALMPSISTEVNRLKSDLENEGYVAKIKSFPNNPGFYYDTTLCKGLWDSLAVEYSDPSQMVAGAILIGKLPWAYEGTPSVGLGYTRFKEVYYWCMSRWLRSDEQDTANPVVGERAVTIASPNFNSRGYYMTCVPNIWVSRLWGIDDYAYGSEVELTKRMLQANHDYRTGISRLPQTAYYHNTRLNERNMDPSLFNQIWPSVEVRPGLDTTSTRPEVREMRLGGELWDVNCDGYGGYSFYSVDYIGGTHLHWAIWRADLFRTNMQLRFILAEHCHCGNPGGIDNAPLWQRNGHCVLSVGSSDYIQNNGEFSPADTSYWQGNNRYRKYLSQGDRFGSVWKRANVSLWATTFHGDLSLKPNMTPSNAVPVISTVSAEKTGAMSWRFTVNAADADGSVSFYEWWPAGYNSGANAPALAGASAGSCDYTYTSAAVCTLRVEVEDNYKARDYCEIVMKPDSGIVMVLTPPLPTGTGIAKTAVQTVPLSPLAVSPNPFQQGMEIRYLAAEAGPVKARIVDPAGRVLFSFENKAATAGSHTMAWSGRDSEGSAVPAGVYFLDMRVGKSHMQKTLFVVR